MAKWARKCVMKCLQLLADPSIVQFTLGGLRSIARGAIEWPAIWDGIYLPTN